MTIVESRSPVAQPAPATLPMLWVDGVRVDPAARHLSALDRGFMLADGLFETMRVYNGTIFRLDRHLARLTAGARTLGICPPTELADMIAEAMHAARAAGIAEACVRCTVSRGLSGPGVLAPPEVPPTSVLVLCAVPSFAPTIYSEGLAAHIVTGRRNEWSPTSGVKTLSYTDAVVAALEARRAGADEAILLDTAGHISETPTSNIFVCIGGALRTPPRSCGILPGITREAVMELAPSLGLEVAEPVVTEADLFGAAEVFVTSSLREVAPVVRVNGRPIGSGVVGPVTRRIMDAYAALVRRECAA